MLENIQSSLSASNRYMMTSLRGKESQRSRSKRVLIVDDNQELRLVLAESLIHDGFKVSTAFNGLEGLNYLSRNEPPDLILLDLTMPIMDGYDMMGKIRTSDQLKKIPVIIISGEVDQVRIRALAMEKLAFLPKPLDLQNMVDVVVKATF